MYMKVAAMRDMDKNCYWSSKECVVDSRLKSLLMVFDVFLKIHANFVDQR